MFKLIIFGLLFYSFNVFSNENMERHKVIIDGKMVVFWDANCSETSYCADGYTTLGVDRLGNKRSHIYPKKTISYNNYLKSFKSYDSYGYNEYGFDRNDQNINGVFAHEYNVLEY